VSVGSPLSIAGVEFREGSHRDLYETFRVSEIALHSTACRLGLAGDEAPGEQELDRAWEARRPLLEMLAAQPEGAWWICEHEGRPIGHGRVCRFGAMEQLTELMVLPAHHGRGIGRELLSRLWPGDPTPELGRLVVAAGVAADLSLYAGFGTMPATGHWHLRAETAAYRECRAQETDAAETRAHVLEPARALSEWARLEPPAIAHRRPQLHELFARSRTCLATMDADESEARALCWIGARGEIGPAVAKTPEELVPVVLGALDRVAKAVEPQTLHVHCSTDSWWLLRRLRGLGLRVWWPSWIMSSIPLPGLDRYLPAEPATVL
jgi:GNAT superfamily N-acetyltransferase